VSQSRRQSEGVLGSGLVVSSVSVSFGGLVRPSSGRITYDGRDLRRTPPHRLARVGIARTLQGVGLFRGLTVAENVMAGAEPSARASLLSAFLGLRRSGREEARLRQRADEVLRRLGIERWGEQLPETLPYAVRKRAALARALMAPPSLLLLDEPAGGLSEHEQVELQAVVGELRPDMGILLVEHRMDFVMSTCDRLVVLDFGRVIKTGPPEEVQADPQVLRAYLGEEVPASAGPGSAEPGAGEETRARS
jgi:branched-chain amino acid transport system ATP-binding protein